jgi:hypothetical protein
MEAVKEKELTRKDPEFLPVQYDLTEAKLLMLAEEYDIENIPKAVEKGDEGYLAIHAKVMDITAVRTKIEKVRKDLKADALAWGKEVDGEAKRLTGIVKDIEEPWRQIKIALEEKEAREAQVLAEAATKRMEEIEANIAGIKHLAEGLLGKTAVEIQERIVNLQGIKVTEDLFGEYVEAATIIGDTIRLTLVSAWEERTAFEDGQAALAAQKTEMAENQARMDQQQRDLDKQKSEQEASERAVEAAKKDEDDRKASIKAETERKAQAAVDAKKDKAKMKKRLPQDKALRVFADQLDRVFVPTAIVKDHNLITVLDDALDYLSNAIDGIRANTQGGE